MTPNEEERSYWSSYYSQGIAPILPSQFAAFVANELLNGELQGIKSILEAGCGNGRDALFFIRHGYRVHAMDASEAAIKSCQGQLTEIDTNGRFMAAQADEQASWDALARDIEGPLLVYTRFFFHAIDDEAQNRVLDSIASLIKSKGGALCVEARSNDDAERSKVTPAHYRRFIDPSDFAAAVTSRGLEVVYQVAGRGMAKYQNDDAYVFRLVARG